MDGMPDFMQVGVLNDVSGMTGRSSILIPVPVRRRACNRGLSVLLRSPLSGMSFAAKDVAHRARKWRQHNYHA